MSARRRPISFHQTTAPEIQDCGRADPPEVGRLSIGSMPQPSFSTSAACPEALCDLFAPVFRVVVLKKQNPDGVRCVEG
jgi:hypothetical protein